MQDEAIGANRIIYVDPSDDFPTVARAISSAGQTVVLVLPENGGALSGPADFHALKQLKRAHNADVRLVMARRPGLQALARRCGFPVFPSLESSDAGTRRPARLPGACPPLQSGRPLSTAGETEALALEAPCPIGRGAAAGDLPGAPPLRMLVGNASHPGLGRALTPNEDCIFSHLGRCPAPAGGQPVPFGLFVVSDGMGGHVNGQEASLLAIRTLSEWVLPRLSAGDANAGDALLAEGVQQANRALCRVNGERQTDMGAVLTAALVLGTVVSVANVGDCRTYLYRPGTGLCQITNDHSPQADRGRAGRRAPTDRSSRKRGHEITRRLGGDPCVSADVFALPCLAGDILLLCSDGLWGVVGPAVLERVLRAYATRPSISCRTLVEAALEAGGPDNISALVVSIQQQAGGSPASAYRLAPVTCPAGPLEAGRGR